MSREAHALELVGIAVEAAQADRRRRRPSSMMRAKAPPCCSASACSSVRSMRAGSATSAAAVAPRCVRPRSRATPIGARLRVASRWVVALADGLELPLPHAAAVAGDVATAYTLYARTGLGPREPVVIVGDNAVSRFLVEILRAKGITPAVIVELADDAWRDWLLAKGAAVVARTTPTLTAAVTAAVERARHRQPAVARDRDHVDGASRAAALAGPRATLTAFADRSSRPCPATCSRARSP